MSRRKAVMIVDAVIRKQRFLAAHPDVTIEHRTAPAWHRTARWTDADGVQRGTSSFELGGLMDQLEALDGQGTPRK